MFLLQFDHAHAAERVGVVGRVRENRRKTCARRRQIVAVERGETVGDRAAARIVRLILSGALARGLILHDHAFVARLHGGIVGRELQIGVETRLIRGPRREPQQRLTPALTRLRSDLAVVGEHLQTRDAVAARGVAIREVLRVGERIARIVGIVARELVEALARLVPAVGRGRERLVILEPQLRRGGHAVERLLILLDRRRALAHLRETPRVVHGLVARARLPEAAAQIVDAGIVRRDLAQLFEIGLGAAAVLAVGHHHAHAEQRIGLFRVEAQHLFPRLLREVAAAMRLPVLALIDERLERVVGGVRERRVRERNHARQRERERQSAERLARGGLLLHRFCRFTCIQQRAA